MQSKQVNKNNTTLMRIDKGYHQLLKIKAAKTGKTIKELVESHMPEILAIDNDVEWCMQLDKNAINEFKKLYFQEYRIRLSDDEAYCMGTRLVKFVKAVLGPDVPPPKLTKKA